MEKGGIFDNDIRTNVYAFILKNPGLHMSALSRKMSIPKSTLNYHLNCLIKDGYIAQMPDGIYIRYYIRNTIGERDKKLISIIRQNIPYRILLLLFLDPDATQIQLSKYLDRHPTTISFHIDKLIELGIIEGIVCGNHIHYHLKNPEQVSDLVCKYIGLF